MTTIAFVRPISGVALALFCLPLWFVGACHEESASPRDLDAEPTPDARTVDDPDGGDAVPDAGPLSDAASDAAAPPADAEPDAASPAHPVDAVEPATPSSLAVRSAPDYADNQSGLIATSRLLTWLEDWANTRPSEVPGDLVIVQLDAASEPGKFIKGTLSARHEGGVEVTRRVRVYDGADLRFFLEPRSNGLTAVGSVPANGTRIDTWLRKHDVRPNHDFVLLTVGKSSEHALGGVARAWLTLRYWGAEHAFLGLHNGSVDADVPAANRQAFPDAPGFDGTARVSDLINRHFVLLADVGAVRDALGKDTLVDVRTEAEYAGSVLGTSPVDNTCRLGAPHCTPSFSGRIKGAVHLAGDAIIDPVDYTIRPLAQLDLAFANAGIAPSKTAIVYDGDQGFSAAVTFALLAVTGAQARWYAASFLEWGALNAAHPTAGLQLLPAENPWRTDVFGSLTEGSTLWADTNTCIMPLLLDTAPERTDRVQQVDLNYKRTPPALPPVGGGENACL